jgi:FtsP/CotA-like multicopper oxidase with cupredoxin domain
MSKMNRRDMLKVSFLASGALLVSAKCARAAPLIQHPTGGLFDELSPTIVDPFEDELHSIRFKTPLPGGVADLMSAANGSVQPNGTVYPQVNGTDALTTYRNSLERIVALQQRNSGNNEQFRPQLFYVLKVKEAKHAFHSKPPYAAGSVIWGYDGMYPGPTFRSRHGVPILVRIVNDLYDLYYNENGNPRPSREIPGGFGDPHISTHLHNGHTASESDGNPADVYPPLPEGAAALHVPKYPDSIKRLRFRDHHYALFRAGLNPLRDASQPAPNVDQGDIAESLSTLWYHDHSVHFTAQNTYKGLVGVHLVYDEIDTGNENDPVPALKLPSDDFDIPLVFQDKQFRLIENAAGEKVAELHLPPKRPPGDTNPITSGFLGDVVAVNGQLKPKLRVKRRKYRFRLVNAGPSRFYQFFLTKRRDLNTSPVADQGFVQIGSDESLLEKPYQVPATEGLLLSVAERADIVIDFHEYAAGDKLYLVNRLIMLDSGEGPDAIIQFPGGQPTFAGYKTVKVTGNNDPGDYLLQFDVVNDLVNDPSNVPPELRKNPILPRYLFPDHWISGGISSGDLKIAAKKGQTLVFRQIDRVNPHGIVFTDESLVLLQGDIPATKPNAILKQTDDFRLYNKKIDPVPGAPREFARFEVIQDITTAVSFICTEHRQTMKGRVEQAPAGGPAAPAEVTIDAGPGAEVKSKDELKQLKNRREFEFAQFGPTGREWTINGRPFHVSPAGSATFGVGTLDVPRNSIVQGIDGPDGEVWTIKNTGAWAHPVHIHMEEFRILRRNGELPKDYENCKKDVLRLDPLTEVQIYIRFRDFLGKYPIHCHNVIHEDHEMMLRFDVVGDW